MLRWIALLLVLMLLALQWKLWVGDGGLREVHWLRAQVDTQQAQNGTLEQRNQALAAEVVDLKQGEQAIEGRARSGLGLIKPGEMFYQIVEPAHASSNGEKDGD
ncbi:MAG TPA: cell division protein FtsB [Rhodanobacteraceae bacterium]|nr:cell division protein FtsB [Rhodanobacteraceae bacterium]